MSSTLLFPATEALCDQGRIRPKGHTSPFIPSKVDFDMNSIFEQAVSIESAGLASFPKITWSFESDPGDNEDSIVPNKMKERKQIGKPFDDLLKAHRKRVRSKHGVSNRMVRSKSQFNGLSCLGRPSSTSHSPHSFTHMTTFHEHR